MQVRQQAEQRRRELGKQSRNKAELQMTADEYAVHTLT